MAKVKIQGHASGTGVLTVTAPNTSSDRTITLPDSTGTILDENSSLPAANLTGTVADARISTLTASKLSGALPAISGASLTSLPSSTEYAHLNTTYDSSTTGTMALTGAGFTPKFVLVMLIEGITKELSWGCASGTGASDDASINNRYNEGANTWTIQPELAFVIEGTSTYARLAVSSFDADGITLTKLKSGSPTGVITLEVFLFA